MDAFVWDKHFITGLETVDTQHRHLVEIVNRVGAMLISDNSSEEDVQSIFKELAGYARYHFAEEEKLMEEVGIDQRHISLHKQHHGQFVEQLVQMWRSRATLANPAEILHGFLAAWLSFHILEEDHSMARQIDCVRMGELPEKAYSFEQQMVDSNVAVLLAALNKLYRVLSLQNRELATANQGLEDKVTERTRELTLSNERLAASLRKMEEAQNQLLQSEKMAAVGQLAAGVAHEINNPIGFVSSNLCTLKKYSQNLLDLIDAHEQCADGQPVHTDRLAAVRTGIDMEFLRQDLVELLGESRDGLERVRKIVQDLKDFACIDEAEWQNANLNSGLDSTLNIVQRTIGQKAGVIKAYGDLPLVRCIPGQMNQVFMNLLINAAQAIDQRGTITIRTGTKDGSAWVAVSDTGHGMTPDVAKRVFEPFFTTKAVGMGIGLGLSLVYDIVVKKHGGRIDIDSTPGQGTTFTLWLPLTLV